MSDDGLGWFRELDPIEQQSALAHAAVVGVAKVWVDAVWKERDLRAAWRLTDPQLRRCWAQQYLYPILVHVRADGYDPDEVVEALVVDEPEHPIWVHFERVQLRGFQQMWPDMTEWGIGMGHHPEGPDLEAIWFAPPGVEVIGEGEPYRGSCCASTMRRAGES